MEMLNVFSGAFGDEIEVEVLVWGVRIYVFFLEQPPLFLLRVLAHLSGRIFVEFDESYCFWLFILWDVFFL